MSKIGYFVAGIVTGAVGLGAAAYLVSDSDDAALPESDSDDEEDTAGESEPTPSNEPYSFKSATESVKADKVDTTDNTDSPSDTNTPEEPAQA